jgi:CheY-like chemotaxis protein
MPTILLADDSITIQKIVNLTFSGEGIDVVTVGNGEAAVKKIHELRPALVLADIFMPGKNGYEVCDYVKSDPSLSITPVILLVGAFEPFDSNEAARVKADGHLTKPFEIKVLISAVNSLISAAGEQKEAAELAPKLPVSEVADSAVPDEPVVSSLAPLPDMPTASRSAWEAEVSVELLWESTPKMQNCSPPQHSSRLLNPSNGRKPW